MPIEWVRRPLESVGVKLLDCLHKTPEEDPSGTHRYVAIPQMSGGRLNIADARRISEEDFIEWTEKADPQSHDVVLSRRCNPGETAYVAPGERFAVGQNLVILRADGESIFPPFLRWLVRSPEWWLQVGKYLNVGAVFDSLKCRDIPKFILPIPPLDEQRAIAGVLGALDDKIEHNRRTARALEQLARAMFRAWFVDFEPVKARAAGATAFPSMPQPVFDALPTRLVDSGVGPVPEGWAVKAVSGIFDVNPTRSLRKGESAPYLDMKSMPTNAHAPDSWIERPFGSGMRFMNGDTLVARITPCLENGKTAFVDFLEDGQIAWGSTEYIVLRPPPPLPPIFAYCLARTGEFRDFAIQNMTGTSGRQRVSPSVMDHFRLPVPSREVAVAFGEVVNPMFACIRGGMEESRKLAEMRDYLLPKLLIGAKRFQHNAKVLAGEA